MEMIRTFFTLGLLNLSVFQFDTQDNLVKTINLDWTQNVDLETFEPQTLAGLWRDSNTTFWVKTKKPIKSIRINNFPFKYRVVKVNPQHFVIKCARMQEYWDQTDIIEIIVKR